MLNSRIVHVIDPDEAVGEALTAFLGVYDFEVHLYREVEDFVTGNRFDSLTGGCLLVDMDRSIQSVLALLHRIGASYPGFPVFLMTSMVSTEKGRSLFDVAVSGVIKKPFIHATLIEQLSRLFPDKKPV